jgi:hypothetical protein
MAFSCLISFLWAGGFQAIIAVSSFISKLLSSHHAFRNNHRQQYRRSNIDAAISTVGFWGNRGLAISMSKGEQIIKLPNSDKIAYQ